MRHDPIEIGERRVDSSVICVLTRFGLRYPWHLAATRREYLTVARLAEQARVGLLKQAFLIESPTSCLSLSVWRDDAAIPLFGTAVPEHVEAARRVFGRLRFHPGVGPELWSTRWRLASISNNLLWPGMDLVADFPISVAE